MARKGFGGKKSRYGGGRRPVSGGPGLDRERPAGGQRYIKTGGGSIGLPAGPGPDIVEDAIQVQKASVEVAFKAAEAAGMAWDDDADFMALSKQVTGKERIDDMTSEERASLITEIEKAPAEDLATVIKNQPDWDEGDPDIVPPIAISPVVVIVSM